tara:strand:- start:242 stop:931 length:690 start_codon:yes stop_codon:yes gene_type:complete
MKGISLLLFAATAVCVTTFVNATARTESKPFVFDSYLKGSEERILEKTEEYKESYRLTQYTDTRFVNNYIRINHEHDDSYNATIGIIRNRRDLLWDKYIFELSIDDWESFLAAVIEPNFHSIKPTSRKRGMDGQWLVFEGIKDGQFHYVARWAPRTEDEEAGSDFVLEVFRKWNDLLYDIWRESTPELKESIKHERNPRMSTPYHIVMHEIRVSRIKKRLENQSTQTTR